MNESIPDLPTSILIVDDNPTNLKVLYEYLTEQRHHVLVAEDGETAIEQAQYSLPDLILLDVMMPGIDGFETCRRLKEIAATREIPVIFMTALADTPFIVNGFTVGAVDYLTKPLQHEEVKVRIASHVQIRRLQKELRKEIEVRLLAERELRQANADKDRFFEIISHDLKNPMNGALHFSEVLLEAAREKKDPTLEEIAKIVHESTTSVSRLVFDLLEWAENQMSRIEVQPKSLDLGDLLQRNIALAGILARQKQINIVNKVGAPVRIHADERTIDTVIRNLLSNAVKFTPVGGQVEIAARTEDKEVTVSITDSGVGITSKNLLNLFQLGEKVSTYGTGGETGTGLGLLLCKEMVDKNGGRIWAESKTGKGSTFSFTVPASAPSAPA